MKDYGITVIGNAGRDAEHRKTQGGADIYSVSVGTYAGKDNTTWVKLFTFENNALSDVRKGDKVKAWGGLVINEYTNKQGEHKTSIELKVWECEVLPRDSKPQQSSEPEMAVDSSDVPF